MSCVLITHAHARTRVSFISKVKTNKSNKKNYENHWSALRLIIIRSIWRWSFICFLFFCWRSSWNLFIRWMLRKIEIENAIFKLSTISLFIIFISFFPQASRRSHAFWDGFSIFFISSSLLLVSTVRSTVQKRRVSFFFTRNEMIDSF